MLVRDVRMTRLISELFEQDVAPLIENVAGGGFSSSLFQLAHKALGCVHMNAVAVNKNNRKKLVLAENIGTSDIARHLGSRYIDQYWSMDPVNTGVYYDQPGLRLYEIGPQDIVDSGYRQQCYTSVDVGARMTACETRADGMIRISFYRLLPFSDREKDMVVSSLGLLLPLLRRHSLDLEEPPETVAEFDSRLRKVAPSLSERERQVCALIALGVTSEGIGLELGISMNTVLTYRKRAYERLGIVSQNQLLRLVCAGDQHGSQHSTSAPVSDAYAASAA